MDKTILIVDARVLAALIAQLGEQTVCVVDTAPEFKQHGESFPIMINPRRHAGSLYVDKPCNHPDGWYRKFEKRNKRK